MVAPSKITWQLQHIPQENHYFIRKLVRSDLICRGKAQYFIYQSNYICTINNINTSTMFTNTSGNAKLPKKLSTGVEVPRQPKQQSDIQQLQKLSSPAQKCPSYYILIEQSMSFILFKRQFGTCKIRQLFWSKTYFSQTPKILITTCEIVNSQRGIMLHHQ